jgi:fructose-1,6-bisphosphatase/inositol monophosphatase family enzyme
VDALHIVEFFTEVARQIRERIDGVQDWGLSGQRDGQYTIDVAADATAVDLLTAEGFGVLSEESGHTNPDRPITAIVDPIDGSTNASAGLPWYATSLCALDADGPVASVVVNQATGTVWSAIRGQGALRDGVSIRPSGVTAMNEAFLTFSGLPSHHYGWRQFRCYGAAALDICSVADGTFDGFADLSVDAHGSWDYIGAQLILQEAGGVIVDLHGRDLVARNHADRRTPQAAATRELLDLLVHAVQKV